MSSFGISIAILNASCGSSESADEAAQRLLAPNTIFSSNVESTTDEETPETETPETETPTEPEPPAPKLLLHLDAGHANAGYSYIPGCDATKPWTNLAPANVSGVLTNFLPGDPTSVCNTQSIDKGLGWNGIGTPSDPFRFEFKNLISGLPRVVNIPDHPALNHTDQITIVLYMKPTSAIDYDMPFIKKGAANATGGNEQYAFFRHSPTAKGAAAIKINNQMKYIYSTSTWNSWLNQWKMIVITYDGAKLRLFIDAVLNSSMDVSGPITTSNQPLSLGGDFATGYDKFGGAIAAMLIYDKALPTETIVSSCKGAQPVLSGLNCP